MGWSGEKCDYDHYCYGLLGEILLELCKMRWLKVLYLEVEKNKTGQIGIFEWVHMPLASKYFFYILDLLAQGLKMSTNMLKVESAMDLE